MRFFVSRVVVRVFFGVGVRGTVFLRVRADDGRSHALRAARRPRVPARRKAQIPAMRVNIALPSRLINSAMVNGCKSD
jgi:hypothetical protein